MPAKEIQGGDVIGAQVRRAVVGSISLAVVFTLWVVLSKESRTVEAQLPWQDDPFDILTSFDFVLPPVVVAVIVTRSVVLSSPGPTPIRRALELLRACAVLMALCGVTELSYWVAVLLGLHRSEWDTSTGWAIGGLSVLSVATVGAGMWLARATGAIRKSGQPSPHPDWLDDAVAAAVIVAGVSGPLRNPAQHFVVWVDQHVVALIRRRPALAGLALATVLSLPFVIVKWRVEHYPAVLLVLSFLLPVEAICAALWVAGRIISIPASARRQHPLGSTVAVGGCLGGVAVFAFHDALLTHPNPSGALLLLLGASLAAAVLTLFTYLALKRARH
ncbi:hypothetical protein [Raineyella fluvialis]|uniref:Uncharacterized protein n=1 Tax=Raineyella fluvialis TaxID=2662261 RepID=A0A5Q2FFL8_9ACTN|nr:hypothetical protein [Raineyella fluvialis]QGF23475.1 hypothetical protein Rai3103_07115 [Raineyella fluvialis]